MYKCKLCGKEKHSKREMHGHFMYAHRSTYAEHDYKMVDLIEEDSYAEPPKEKPLGFRYLSKADDLESMAIGQGYLFIDEDQNIYTEEEAKAKGWI